MWFSFRVIILRGMIFPAYCHMSRVSLLFGRNYSLMDVKIKSSYEEAVYALNGLQSNFAYLKDVEMNRIIDPSFNITETERHLNRLGIKVEDLNNLNIIHVSGTKGKGSTCAFTESILRHHNLRTGFYSSPHLISVNERIRINGRPIDKAQFASYFWNVFYGIQKSLEPNKKMPSYFMFITILAFYIFIKEKVDLAVIEVGIGGLYDCTNVIKSPVVVGVTTLGLDHVNILGNTLDLIARQKAGIFKPGVPAFTTSQSKIALDVLIKQAHEIGCSLTVASPLQSLSEQNFEYVNLGIPGSVQYINAGLAVQLSNEWLRQKKNLCLPKYHRFPLQSSVNLGEQGNHLESSLIKTHIDASPCNQNQVDSSLYLDQTFRRGLQLCKWPGRFYTVKNKNISFYLDGAHTAQSIQHCAYWFQQVSKDECDSIKSNVSRILIFNCTGQRKPENLLKPLSELDFNFVIFTPNSVSLMQNSSSDQCNLMTDPASGQEICKNNKDVWCHLNNSHETSAITLNSQLEFVPEKKYIGNVLQFSSLGNTMAWLMEGSNENNSDFFENNEYRYLLNHSYHIQVLITGSLHLVGNTLSIIDPDFNGMSI